MSSADAIRQILGSVNSGKSIPALSLVQNDPETAAVISKLVAARELRRFDTNDSKSIYDLDQSRLNEISTTVKERINDAEGMMQLFPDMELAAQILISSILSPKDMVNTEIIYSVEENVLPADVSMKIIESIRSHCEQHYKLKSSLPEKLREVLFDSGCYVSAIIPESSVDELINKGSAISTEHLTELFDSQKKTISLGILGNPTKPTETPNQNGVNSAALESFNLQRIPYEHFQPYLTHQSSDNNRVAFEDNVKNFVEITDNYTILKLPKIIEANNRFKIRNAIRLHGTSTSLESRDPKITGRELQTLLYKGTQSNAVPFTSVKTTTGAKRKTIGRPLAMRLPAEATIPVHVPGDPKKHIGYFVLVDEEGNPVTRNTNTAALSGLQSQLNNQNSSMSSFLLQKARKNLVSQDTKNLSIDQAARIYSDIVESDLIERLKNGIYGSNAEISDKSDVYRIMLARTFANQYTRLVYIPCELVTYYAYKYYDNGIGKSLLDDLKVITSLRAILLFAKVMATTKNSIALTHVNMTIDPNDPDPYKTIEMSIHEIIKMRQQYFPLGINSPSDLVDWIQRAGFEFSFEGHPGIPQTKFDFETKNMQHTIPDNELDELLRKQSIMAVGLSPETVDNGFNSEFATTVVANNILLSKRVLQIQNQIEPHLTDEARKICFNDAVIRSEVIAILKENVANIDKYLPEEDRSDKNEDQAAFFENLLDHFLYNLSLSLPKPDITTLENQSQAYEHYAEAVEKAIDAFVSSEFITSDIAGDLSNNIDSIKQVYKAYFLRQWMAQNGYMTELNEILSVNEDGRPNIELFDMMKTHIDSILRGSVKFIKSMDPMKKAANKDLEALNLDNSNVGDSSSSSDSSSTDSETSEFGGMGGDLDFGIGDDVTETQPTDELTDEENTDNEENKSEEKTDNPPEVSE